MTLISRYDVFPATVVRRDTRVTVIARAAGREFRALLRNTGRLVGLIHPGTEILCLPKEGGKTAAQVLGAVVDGERAALLDTLVQARAFEAAAQRGLIPWLPAIVRHEVRVRDSRLDYEIELAGNRGFLELKSAVHLRGECATYPDAPSARGRRHIALLTELSQEGYPCLIAFITAHPAASRFCPDVETDPEIGTALLKARAAGVGIHALKMHLMTDGRLVFDSPQLPVVLENTPDTTTPVKMRQFFPSQPDQRRSDRWEPLLQRRFT